MESLEGRVRVISNQAFETNSDLLIPKYLEPSVVLDLRYFKLLFTNRWPRYWN